MSRAAYRPIAGGEDEENDSHATGPFTTGTKGHKNYAFQPSRAEAFDQTTASTRNSMTLRSPPHPDDDRPAATPPPSVIRPSKPRPPAWRDLPKKGQLFIILVARLSEPLVQTSLQSYMFYQLKWFDPSLPDSTISSQAGVLHASFTAAQFLTALFWGRVADSPLFGRKTVLLIGLTGTCISSLGYGFSTTFTQALLFRMLGGVTNGNVGVMRTMISEVIREKKYQSRAFLILPMTFNIGVMLGPVMGGLLSDPAGSYPDTFEDVAFLKKYPYALPNVVSAVFLFNGALAVFFGLEETLDSLANRGPGLGSRMGYVMASWARSFFELFRPSRSKAGYRPLNTHDRTASASTNTGSLDVDLDLTSPTRRSLEPTLTETKPKTHRRNPSAPRYTRRLPFRRIFTKNVLLTLICHALLHFHVATFNSLWFVFLSTPVYDPSSSSSSPSLPFRFTGGLGFPPRTIGIVLPILGAIGITLQLTLYPYLSGRLGILRSFRLFLAAFPLAYALAPFLAIVPSSTAPPAPKDGPAVWAAVVLVLFLQVCGRTFALPGQTILVNNCTPHPSVLGSMHGLGQSVSSASRTVGPMLGGWLYGVGLAGGVVGGVWWGLAGVAVVGLFASWFVREGDGHEIWLEGDVDDEGNEMESAPLRTDEEAARRGNTAR